MMAQRPIFNDSQPVSGGTGISFSDKLLRIPYNIMKMDRFLYSSSDISIAFFYKIKVENPSRIRAYNSLDALNADRGRPTYQKPKAWGFNNHGCIFDVVIGANNSSLFFNLAPISIFAGNELHLSIENLLVDAVSGLCDLHYLG